MAGGANNHIARIESDLMFADGKVRTVRPLTIKRLRKFVIAVESLDTDNLKMTAETIDRMLSAAAIVMEEIDPELAKNPDALSEAIDMDIFSKMMTVAMGSKLDSGNV